ncbi:C-type lectin domain family 4 member F-like [Fundulus heteroclitus]|uniref:C-type lectin domain family 4 member F-like n=1 Tax=Fundulus heteroclitus TaxID=8078 RepID=UPI00165ABC94|nr:C-type lectin domain family 4 member F-like [Fundulus heteroclitus]
MKQINFDIEAKSKNLKEERDDLKRKLNGLASEKNLLAGERDTLKRMNSDFQVRNQNLTLERDELKKINLGIEASLKSLTAEKDELIRTISIIEANNTNLTEDRDERRHDIQNNRWEVFEGSAYYVSVGKKTWQESRRYCKSQGADLMVINSQEEQVFANGFNKYMWIGLTDLETEGTWKWVDGSRLTSRYWKVGEPNGQTNENCGNIKTYESLESWNDEQCEMLLNWICEMSLT